MLDVERLLHSFKTAIACLIGVLISPFTGIQNVQWVVITILVVMCSQIYVGSVLQKSFLRFLGTLMGSCIALITIVSSGPNYPGIIVAICLASFIFSYIATGGNDNLMYASSLGAITTALILLSTTPNIDYALARFLDISLGILIATVISQFLLPIHARTHLRRTQAKTLEQIKEWYKQSIVSFNADPENLANRDFEEDIVKLLFKQRKLTKEAKTEPFGAYFDLEHCARLLQLEKDILRAIDFMNTALINIRHAETILLNSPVLQAFNQNALNTLTSLVKTIASNTKVNIYIEPFQIKNIREEFIRHLPEPSREELIYVDGFAFCAEILMDSLTKLASLYRTLIDDENPQ